MKNRQELCVSSESGSFEDPSNNHQVGVDVLKSVIRHKSLLAFGVVVALVVGALYYAKTTPIYESTAKILIVNKRPETVSGGVASYFNDYMSTHQAVIVSPVVVERAIKANGVGNIEVDELIDGLKVSPGTKTSQATDNILKLSYRGEDPAECVAIVNSVLASYQEFLEETYNNMSSSTLELMTEARDTLLVELKDQEEQYRHFRENSPLVSSSEQDHSQSRLSMIEAEQSALLMKKAELESHLATIQKAQAVNRDAAYMSELIANLSAKSRPQTLTESLSESEKRKSILLPLLQQEKRLMQSFGSSHPAVISIQRRVQVTREIIDNPELYSVNINDTKRYIQFLTQELERVTAVQSLLTPIYETEIAATKELTVFQLRDQQFQRNMDRTQQLYDGVIAQLQDAKLSKDYGGFKADVINPPQFGKRVQPKLSIVLAASLVLGCVLGTLLALTADQIDTGFKTSEEIRSHVNLPVIGRIPLFVNGIRALESRSDVSIVDSSLTVYHWPQSAETESYRRLRTGLYFSTSGQTNKVIQVTSPCPGDGKSTIASNLSVCIAQSGKHVLLIDADMRRPRQHSIFGLDSTEGLSTVLALDQEFSDVIVESPIDNLWVMPSGPIPPDPAELLTSERFSELISAVRETYDYVIVDTGPLLAISDPSIVSPQVDGVILAVRLKKTKRMQVSQAKDILVSLDAPIIGIVANAIVNSDEKYGYHSYGDYHQEPSNKLRVKSSLAASSANLGKITAS